MDELICVCSAKIVDKLTDSAFQEQRGSDLALRSPSGGRPALRLRRHPPSGFARMSFVQLQPESCMHHQKIALRLERAAQSIDVSIPTFRKLVDQGRLPRPIENGNIRLWLADELRKSLAEWPRTGEDSHQRDTVGETIALIQRQMKGA